MDSRERRHDHRGTTTHPPPIDPVGIIPRADRRRRWTVTQGSLEFAEVSRDTVVDDELEAEVKVDTKKVKAEHQKAVSAAAKSLVPAIRQQLVSFDTEFKARAEGGA
jgi:hypothetical protein